MLQGNRTWWLMIPSLEKLSWVKWTVPCLGDEFQPPDIIQPLREGGWTSLINLGFAPLASAMLAISIATTCHWSTRTAERTSDHVDAGIARVRFGWVLATQDIYIYNNMNQHDNNLRLFQHTFGTHPGQPLPTGYKGIPFIIGERGISWGVLWGCVAIFLDIVEL